MQDERMDARPAAATVIRPRRSLLRQTALAVLALVVPLGAALLVLAIPSGNADAVLLGAALVVVLGALLTMLYLTSYVRVSASGEVESRFLGRRTVLRADTVTDLVLLHVYQGLTLETQARLFAMDADGRLLLRLSGHVYDLREMQRVAQDLGLPIAEQTQVLSLADLRGTRRAILPWYERSRIQLAGVLVLLGLATAGAVLGIMVVTGVPVTVRL